MRTLLTVFVVAVVPCFHTATGQITETKLTAGPRMPIDEFGNSVSISGDYAVVGAPYDDDNGYASGSAYVFHMTV